VAMRAHNGRQRFHLKRLEAGQPQPSSVKGLLLASLRAGPEWAEATRLATAGWQAWSLSRARQAATAPRLSPWLAGVGGCRAALGHL
jgi:hypothetical protein